MTTIGAHGYDAIVVGGGIVGAACAEALARRALSVLVLDARLGGATAAGMGHLVTLDDNDAELALTRHSIARWREWSAELDGDCAFRGNGTLWVAANDAELAAAEAKCARLQALGEAAEMLDARALAEAEPALRPGLAGALSLSGDGIVYPPNVVRWLLGRHPRRLTERIARVVEIDGRGVVLADGERLAAGIVVLANGIEAASLCPELPIQPKKGHLAITDRYPGLLTHTVTELGYLSSVHQSDGPSVAFNVQPRPTGQLFIGTSRQFGSRDLAVDGPVLARMLAHASSFLPVLAELNIIRCWTGLRAASPDSLPLIGRHPGRNGLWLAVGHEGLGVTAAPATAELLMAAIFDEPPPIPSLPYAPERFPGVVDEPVGRMARQQLGRWMGES
ncbi:MAG: NAD(P)/FAD-dependent oxidoreductase [Rhodocyclaceae bacterium]